MLAGLGCNEVLQMEGCWQCLLIKSPCSEVGCRPEGHEDGSQEAGTGIWVRKDEAPRVSRDRGGES